jgi:hypothetical protein
MDRDSITRTGARAPGVERLGPLAWRCLTCASSLTQRREYTVKAVGTKDEGKPECRSLSRKNEFAECFCGLHLYGLLLLEVNNRSGFLGGFVRFHT